MRVTLLLAALAATACSPGYDKSKEIELLPVPDDAGAVTWDGWAGAFVRDYCVECHQPSAPCGGSGCHQAGDPALWDFHDKATVVARAQTIQCGVASVQDPAWNCGGISTRKFPKVGDNPLPTDELRAAFVDWLDAGCP